MRALRSLGWWLVPILPAVLATGLVAASETTARICPPYDTPLPPHPEQCLPTLVPALTGANPQRVALSWLGFVLLAYLVVLATGLLLRARGWKARDVGRLGLALGLAALALGFVLVGGSALVAGDWYLARQPWIGLGLELIVVGLAGTGFFAVLLDVVEPVGWWRLLALPPALLVAGPWALYLIIGAPTTGFGGAEHDVATILYSTPLTMAIFTALRLLVALPLVAAMANGPCVKPCGLFEAGLEARRSHSSHQRVVSGALVRWYRTLAERWVDRRADFERGQVRVGPETARSARGTPWAESNGAHTNLGRDTGS